MRIHILSAWLLAFVVVSTTAWSGEASPSSACRAEISRVELYLREAHANRQVIGSAPESLAARLHHQPTPQSVEHAAAEAEQTIETALALARELESKGLTRECAATLKHVELLFDRH